MSIGFYLDEQVPRAITKGLRLRGIDVLTVQEDGRTGEADVNLLHRATELRRVMFTMDADFLAIASDSQERGEFFIGIIFARQGVVSYGRCIDDLETIAVAGDLEDSANRVEYLPL